MWLGHWESHFELHPKPNHTKIVYAIRELGAKATTWWREFRYAQWFLVHVTTLSTSLKNDFSNCLLRLKQHNFLKPF